MKTLTFFTSHTLLLAALLLTACGGGGGGTSAPDVDDTAPTVTSKSPAGGATGVERNATVSATFSEDMFATTIDGGSFTLSDSEGNVSGTVAFDASSNIATLTPAGELTVLGSYTASLGSAITDLAGNALASLSWGFSVRDGVWGTAALIGTVDTLNEESPQIAMDGNGNAIAVWQQHDGAVFNLWTNRFVAGSGWGPAELIESGSGAASEPQIAFDASGNAFAVWSQIANGSSIYANRYVAGSGWLGAELIEFDNNWDAYDPQIAFDASGNAIAVWSQDDGEVNSIYANRYTAGSWGTIPKLIGNGTGNASFQQIAMDASGNAIAVWQQKDGAYFSIYTNRYTAGNWGTAEPIEFDDSGDAYAPQIVMDANGNAIVVWRQNDGEIDNIYANRYTVGGSWVGAVLIESDGTGNVYAPQIAMDANGNAIAVWQQIDVTAENIYVNHYAAGGSWVGAELIETDDAGDAQLPQIAMDANGNALAVWYQYDGTSENIQANRYVAGSGWGAAASIETDLLDASTPQIAINANGSATAVWIQNGGTGGDIIQANRFE